MQVDSRQLKTLKIRREIISCLQNEDEKMELMEELQVKDLSMGGYSLSYLK